MGDIADWLLSSEDPYGDPFEHDKDLGYGKRSQPLRCKYCGSTAVTWAKTEGKWRLYTKGQPHTCAAYVVSHSI